MQAGLILLNSAFQALYANSEAAEILAYPEKPSNPAPLETFLAEQLGLATHERKNTRLLPSAGGFVSGRRHYLWRLFSLDHACSNTPAPSLAFVIERVHPEAGPVSELAERYHLTVRERQAVEFLTEGLTSKEIASRMHISPNTVKAFLHLVMLKTDVSTRSGIVGRVVRPIRQQ